MQGIRILLPIHMHLAQSWTLVKRIVGGWGLHNRLVILRERIGSMVESMHFEGCHSFFKMHADFSHHQGLILLAEGELCPLVQVESASLISWWFLPTPKAWFTPVRLWSRRIRNDLWSQTRKKARFSCPIVKVKHALQVARFMSLRRDALPVVPPSSSLSLSP